MDLNKVKNIIFDLGGVILNINPSLTYAAFLEFGLNKMDNIRVNVKLFNALIYYEKGIISTNEFRKEIKRQAKVKISDKEIDDGWNAMILDIPEEKIKVLEEIKRKKHIFLLSNTNELHYNVYNKYLKENSKYNNFSELFEKDYYSHKMAMRKPDIEIYEYVLKDRNLISHETLFVDDMIENIEAASKTGMQVYLIEGENSIMDLV